MNIDKFLALPGKTNFYDARPDSIFGATATEASLVGNENSKYSIGNDPNHYGDDARVIRGRYGAAVLMQSNFYGVNLDQLSSDERAAFELGQQNTLLHELVHVYSKEFTDEKILASWPIFSAPGTSYGSHDITRWFANDCNRIEPGKP